MTDKMSLIEKLETILKLISDKSEPEFVSLKTGIRKQIDLELNIQSVALELKILRSKDPLIMNELDRSRVNESIDHLESYGKRLEDEAKVKLNTLTEHLGRIIL